MRSWLKLSSAALLVLASAGVMLACAKQGEGERCDIENGNNDCESPNICTCRDGVNAHICCPATGGSGLCARAAAGSICGGSTGDASTSDVGTNETSTDAKSETATETGTDSASDATDDAAGDAGDAADTGTSADAGETG
jgi:hypothetical protein